MTNIGVTSVLGSTLSLSQNTKFVQKGLCAVTERLTSALIYSSCDSGGLPASFKVIVHINNAGIPGALIATSSEVTISAGEGFSWRLVTFATQPTLNSGTYYFFGPHVASGGYGMNLRYQSTGGINFEKADIYSDGPTDPFGDGGGPGTRQYSCYLITEPIISAPAAPTGVTATRDSDVSVTLNWTNNATEDAPYDGQYIQRSADGGAYSQIDVVSGSAVTYNDVTTSSNHYYAYKVKASNDSGDATSSASDAVYNTPAAPSGCVATKTSAFEVEVVWEDNSNTESYFEVARSPNAGVDWTTLSNVVAEDTESYDDTSIPEGTYIYKVRAYRGSLYSAWSSVSGGVSIVDPNPINIGCFIDEFAIWDEALTSTDALDQFDARYLDTSYRDVVCNQLPAGYWSLDESSGDSADLMGGTAATWGSQFDHGYDASLPYGSAARANGDSAGDIAVAAVNAPNPDLAMSIAFWIKCPNNRTQNNYVARKRDSVTPVGWGILYKDASGGSGRLALRLDTSGGTNQSSLYTDTSVLDNQWHHLVWVVIDGTDASKVYIDGVLSQSATLDCGTGFDAASEDLIIAESYGSDEGLCVDEFAIWDRAISASEVLAQYLHKNIITRYDLVPESVYRYEDLNGENKESLDWRSAPDSAVGLAFLASLVAVRGGNGISVNEEKQITNISLDDGLTIQSSKSANRTNLDSSGLTIYEDVSGEAVQRILLNHIVGLQIVATSSSDPDDTERVSFLNESDDTEGYIWHCGSALELVYGTAKISIEDSDPADPQVNVSGDLSADNFQKEWTSYASESDIITTAAPDTITLSSVSVSRAAYCIVGPLCFYEVKVTFTTSDCGAGDNDLKIKVPNAFTIANSFQSGGGSYIPSGGVRKQGFTYYFDTTHILFRKYDASDWSDGSGNTISVSGFFAWAAA